MPGILKKILHKTNETSPNSPKGYQTSYGYMGWVSGEDMYMLFMTEEEYIHLYNAKENVNNF